MRPPASVGLPRRQHLGEASIAFVQIGLLLWLAAELDTSVGWLYVAAGWVAIALTERLAAHVKAFGS